MNADEQVYKWNENVISKGKVELQQGCDFSIQTDTYSYSNSLLGQPLYIPRFQKIVSWFQASNCQLPHYTHLHTLIILHTLLPLLVLPPLSTSMQLMVSVILIFTLYVITTYPEFRCSQKAYFAIKVWLHHSLATNIIAQLYSIYFCLIQCNF